MKRLALIVIVLSVSACVIHAGPGPETYPPAHSAAGVTAWLVLATSRLDGELLEARDTALVILTHDRVMLVPFSVIDSGAFAHSNVAIRHRRRPSPEDFDSIRLLSRYPQGIPPDALRRILADKRQDFLVFIR
ncbi:MAG TPA: hypothetical protein VGH98_18385 [Gemmatimonadaceae bacterium]|jgi:hypothetical protein